MTLIPAQIRQVPIKAITILNPRVRNRRIFNELVTSIEHLGLKKPITVSARPDHPERPRQLDDVHWAASFQRSRDRASFNVDAEHRIIGARACCIRASLPDRRTRGDVADWAGDGTAAGERRTRRYQDSPRTQEGAHELFGTRIGGSANPHPPPQQPVEGPSHRPSSRLAFSSPLSTSSFGFRLVFGI
jgi:hypothetical protein